MDDVENWHWTYTPRQATMPAMSATPLTSAGCELEQLAAGVRVALAIRDDWSRTAELVADQLRAGFTTRAMRSPSRSTSTEPT
jgi:hypothetical protein